MRVKVKELNLVELKKMRGKIARIHSQLRMKKGVKRVSLKTKKLMKKRTRSKSMILLALNQKKKHKHLSLLLEEAGGLEAVCPPVPGPYADAAGSLLWKALRKAALATLYSGCS